MRLYDLFEQHQEEVSNYKKLDLINALRDFLPIAIKHLKLDHIPKIKLAKELTDTHVPTFGRFANESKEITVVINNRQPVDIIRTLAHEMVHYKQGEEHQLASGSWHTGSPEENQAHHEAGIMMRKFDKQFPEYLSADPVVLPEYTVSTRTPVNEQTEVKKPYNPKEFAVDDQGAPNVADSDQNDPHVQLDHEDYATPPDELSVEMQASLPSAFSVEDLNSDFYSVYRLGLALAAGEEHLAQADNIGRHPFIVPDTKVGAKKLQQAVSHQGYKIKERTTPGSVEVSTTNKVSPVAAPKRNKYGV